MTLHDSAFQLLMLLSFGWGCITILLALVGQGALGYLVINYCRNKYWPEFDNKDAKIEYLHAMVNDKTQAEQDSRREREQLVNTVIKNLIEQLANKE